MSDNWITVIPEDPQFIPNAAQREAARRWFVQVAPMADEIDIRVSEVVEFFDCGANLERIVCPSCRGEVSAEWWQQRMDDDHQDGFKLRRYATPCCGASHTLNELIYEWPQGFARFALDVMNPGIGELSDAHVLELTHILGAPLRVIYQHI